MRTIAVVTVGRSDYGIYFPLLKGIQADSELCLKIIVSGMHLSPEFGCTVDAIKEDGFDISDQVEMLLSSDSPAGITKSMGLGLIGFSQAFSRSRPDILVVLGDRFEMHAAALAALPFKIPVAHIHGGEITLGAIDESLRHSMTKLSHLHFTSTSDYARRVIQMGEEPWRVQVSGALSLDNVKNVRILDHIEFAREFGIELPDKFLIVTYHPVTLEYEQVEWQIEELLSALEYSDIPVLFTMPNSDTGSQVIREKIVGFINSHDSAFAVETLGTQGYFSAMSHASVMIGNSSSGIVEAAPFNLPVVNIGTRQQGRVRSENIIDVGYDSEEISSAIRLALSNGFRKKIEKAESVYGDGHAAEKIISVLQEVELTDRLLKKPFFDISMTPEDTFFLNYHKEL
jgi:UDP-hydrolysing UDP-N-acetyl-D-glucosamine 2-epimerase